MDKWKVTLRLIVIVALASTIIGQASFAKEAPKDKGKGLAKVEAFQPDRYAMLNINNITLWQRSDGLGNHSPLGDNGVFFPKGTSYVIYEDGVIWGGRCYTDAALTTPAPYGQPVRVGGNTYGISTVEGWINGEGATATESDREAPDVRIYRVRRDWKDLKEKYALGDPEAVQTMLQEAADCNEINLSDATDSHVQAILDDYEYCWNNWPIAHGAPYIDRNGNGVYDPPPADFHVDSLIATGFDEPGVAGIDPNSPAHQVIFAVWNHLNLEKATSWFKSRPTGMELQGTIWGYKRNDALGKIFFKRVRFINKGGVDLDAAGTKGTFYIDSCYVCQWVDPDLGAMGDDVIGCDTVLNMGFVYNGAAVDPRYRDFGLPPPSGGYDFLQGPALPSPGDVAVFDLKYKQDFKNLGMSGFSYFSAGSPYSDPPRTSYSTNDLRWWKMLRGFAPLDGPDQRYAFPPGVEEGPYPLAGDPVAGTGHLDGQGEDYSFVPGDRRFMTISGPWTMAPGDTQEVVIAGVFGIGSDRISSVSVMKYNDRFAQLTYDALFQVPNPPAAPNVAVTELNQEIVLEWGSDLERVAATEETVSQPGNFVFEGYNVYQLPSAQASLSDGVRIATYDVVNEKTVILDQQPDLASGQVLNKPVQFGSNSGLEHKFQFLRDYVLDRDKINNGSEYYLTVTAYSVSADPEYLPQALESSPRVLVVVPKVPFGTEYSVVMGDTVAHTHPAGGSDGAVYPIVVDQDALTGHNYEVTFTDAGGGATTWSLKDMTTGTTLLTDMTNQSGDNDYPFVDGFQPRVMGAPMDFKSFQCVANADGPIDPPESAAAPWAGFPCPTGVDPDGYPTDGQQVGPAKWLFHTGDNGSRDSYAAFKSRSMRNDNFEVAVPYDWEMRFTEEGSWSYRRFDEGLAVQVPFELWCAGQGTPDDASDDYKLVPGLLENDDNFEYNLSAWGADEHTVSGGDNDPFTDWIYWILPLDKTPGTAGYDAFVAGIDPVTNIASEDALDREVIARSVIVSWNGGSAPPFTQDLPETGTIFRLVTTKPNTPDDVLEFTTPAPETNLALQQASAEKVGVFPNPYYCENALETNKLARFVTFNNLPPKATIRIFNLAGHLVRTIEKDDDSQFARWDLLNMSQIPIASGMYVVHVDMPDVGVQKVLKLAVVMESEVLDVF